MKRWLLLFVALVAFMVVFGGYVRLTRSGLSIVEWNPISGVIPPLTAEDWQREFALYQQTPEFQKVNFHMTLEEYRLIFWIEWIHRFIARTVGLFYALPFFWFLVRRVIPWKEAGSYVLLGLLFIGQAVMGWLMVASGLVDRPSVSHLRLTAHLLLALTLLGASFWIALGHHYGFDERLRWSRPAWLAFFGLVLLVVQISYGGMTAGLKAGYLSNTWPLMFGRWIPAGLFAQFQPSWLNLVESPLTVFFIHRWLPFLGLGILLAAYVPLMRAYAGQREVRLGLIVLLAFTLLQILLGILTVLSHVQIALALLHQGTAIALLLSLLYVLHRMIHTG
uniref:Cytochrome c oxidase assembly transmembrane protein n=1 Tax=uncultured Chloroflexota bacterium TaxID=166587 RepID=H5SQ38_9CHLR|nr:cytochrome c oxidase assembly transmembrane protein [uncultured Chloroflexota bacterium]